LFNLYSEQLNKDVLEGLGDFKVLGEATDTVKYAVELLMLAEEETVIQGVTERLTDVGRCYGMEMNV
jgi:hypothetical protein